ncbi:Neuroligin-4, X-linked [Eumeta japonica]|uniref:Neuroligin-4, X-linked n=1 Tax=Eumeta variegata TaxID=151549 RepID=A0A4C1TBS5_EUMVA|nr:Neuroligin-4, X-linked [Eumeta japonica]
MIAADGFKSRHSSDVMNIPFSNLGGGDGTDAAGLPCLVFVHGESYEWSAGSAHDGTALAAHANIIVVTINFRLGVLVVVDYSLGFLKTGAKGSAQGNFGLMDLVAGLHWLRENLPAFGGDPERVTLMGHGTGAALANFLAVSPVARELLKRVILLSGSGLSSWALQREPLTIKRKVAEQTGCHGDLQEDDLAPCLRNKPLAELLAVRLDPPRFLPGFAPFVDGTVIVNPSSLLANRHLVKLGLIKSERKKLSIIDHAATARNPPTIERSVRIVKRAIRVRAYAAIAEIAVTAGPSAGLS